jgi:hypothetical protein
MLAAPDPKRELQRLINSARDPVLLIRRIDLIERRQ